MHTASDLTWVCNNVSYINWAVKTQAWKSDCWSTNEQAGRWIAELLREVGLVRAKPMGTAALAKLREEFERKV